MWFLQPYGSLAATRQKTTKKNNKKTTKKTKKLNN